MRRQTQLAKLIEASEDKIRYDTQVKKVLANEAILAWILKTCTEEFASCSLHEIRKCIGVPEISRKAVHQNEPDAPLDSDRQIESVGTEDGSLGEQTVFYDIRFHACAPGKARPIHLIINIEAQKDSAPGYPLENRATYYCCRLISAQYGTVFHKSEYGNIRKVYSIWLCSDPARKQANSIKKMAMDETILYGSIDASNYKADLFQVMIINLGNPDEAAENPILHLMNVLLAVDLEAKEKQRVMEKEFHIAMTAELESEVSELCNLSQGVYDKGVKAGISQGINQGMSLGISQGIRATVAILQRYQYQDAEIMEQIMQEYHLTPEEARQYVSVPDSV